MTLQFASDLSPWLVCCVAGALAILVAALYRREPANQASSAARNTFQLTWLLPWLRASTVLLVALTLAQPVFESKVRVGQPGRIQFVIDGSQSMSLPDASEAIESRSSRFLRAAKLLTGESDQSGLLAMLSEEFEVGLSRFGSDGSLTPIEYQASDTAAETTRDAPWNDWLPSVWAESTAIGDALSDIADSYSTARQGESECVVVLLTDGGSNTGENPLRAANQLFERDVKLFTVGIGPLESTGDLTIESVEGPAQVFVSDTLAVSVSLSENLPSGQPYQLSVVFEGQVLWQQELVTQSQFDRQIDFSVPAEDILAVARESLPNDLQLFSLPIKLDARVSLNGDDHTSNHRASMFSCVVVGQSRILLIDGRSRWETRYLRNMFARDPAWEIVSDIRHPSGMAEPSSGAYNFPESAEQLTQFDLIILGDVPAREFQREHLQWLRDAVDRHGVGLVVIDGARENLRSNEFYVLRELFPVRWTGAYLNQLAYQIQPTDAGQQLEALQIGANVQGLPLDWHNLPPLSFQAQVRPLPGSEVLLEAVNELGVSPLLVSRRFGAGQVLYLATDETWKWRYKIADQVHAYVWHQLARWVMRPPYSMRSEFVSLDAGSGHYQSGHPVEVRCQLREDDLSPASGVAVTAIFSAIAGGNERVENMDGQVVSRLALMEDAALPGSYAAVTETLPAGDYTVRLEAAGFPRDALDLATRVSITAPENIELETTTCNQSLLKEIAETAQGQYFHESDISGLTDAIRPLSGGRFERTTFEVWQSYVWFSLIMLLLVGEWILRKRAGLM
jgi:hypothetical protein